VLPKLDFWLTASLAMLQVRVRKHHPTALALLPAPRGQTLLLCGDESGHIAALDVRMMGEGRSVWSARPHQGAITCLSTWAQHPEACQPLRTGAATSQEAGTGLGQRALTPQDLLVSGGKDGNICVLDVSTGAVLHCVERAHFVEKRGPLGLLSGPSRGASPVPGGGNQAVRRARPQHTVAAAVTGLSPCSQGLMSCGLDGSVRFHPFVV
jgi:hypothetical protein